jgi:hypothetical protein
MGIGIYNHKKHSEETKQKMRKPHKKGSGIYVRTKETKISATKDIKIINATNTNAIC